MKMGWEYLTTTQRFSSVATLDNLPTPMDATALAELGVDGWELVSTQVIQMTASADLWYYFFKRPLFIKKLHVQVQSQILE